MVSYRRKKKRQKEHSVPIKIFKIKQVKSKNKP